MPRSAPSPGQLILQRAADKRHLTAIRTSADLVRETEGRAAVESALRVANARLAQTLDPDEVSSSPAGRAP